MYRSTDNRILRGLLKPCSLSLIAIHELECEGNSISVRRVFLKVRDEFGVRSMDVVLRSIRSLEDMGLVRVEVVNRFPRRHNIELTERGKRVAEALKDVVSLLR